MFRRSTSAFALACLLVHSTPAQFPRRIPAAGVADIVKAADQLTASLDQAQQQKLLFKFDDDGQRKRWSNLPSGIFQRRGLRMGDLNDEQQKAVYGLLRATLSDRGYRQV